MNLSILQQSYQLLRSFDKKKAKIIIGFSLAIAAIIIVTLMLTLFVDIHKYHSSTAPRNNIEANMVAGSLGSAYSFGVPMRFGERVVGTPWHFYDK